MKSYLKVFLIFVLTGSTFLCFGSSAQAQDAQVWTNLGIYGGQIYDIAIDPNNPNKMFAGSYKGDGLFMTTDGGNNWQAVEPEGEVTFKNQRVFAVKIAPQNSNVIWVANQFNLVKSTDGGTTWTYISKDTAPEPTENNRFIRSIAVHPGDPDGEIVYVGTSGPNATNDNGAIYKTIDGGVSWTKMTGPVSGNFDHKVVDLDFDPSNPNIIWAVTGNDGEFVEPGVPGGANGTLYKGVSDSWTAEFSKAGGQFYDVEVKPNEPNLIFTANDWGIFIWDDNSTTSTQILNYLNDPPDPGEVAARNVRALAFAPNAPDILYAAWKNSHSFPDVNVDRTSKVAKGTAPYDDANDWEIYTAETQEKQIIDLQFLSLAVHPSSGIIFGGELAKGVYKNQDLSQNWTELNNGINAVIINDVDVDPNDSTHLLAATVAGVYEKWGDGAWIGTSDFLYTHAFSVAFDPMDEDGSTYYAGTQGWLAKTTDSGANWISSPELPNQRVTDIAVDPSGAKVFITTLIRGGGGNVYKITNLQTLDLDPGLPVLSDSSAFNAVVIDPDPNIPDHIFAGSGDYFGTKKLGNLYESKLGGDLGTWDPTGLTNVIVNALLIDPRDSNILYAGCGYSVGTAIPIYKSVDGGTTWTPYHEGIPPQPIYPIRGVWGVSGTDIFAVGLGGAVYNYNGSTWPGMHVGTTEDLYGVWGKDGADVFAVGYDSRHVFHYDGSTWNVMNTDFPVGSYPFYSVWGSSSVDPVTGLANDVYAVGVIGHISYYNGTVWAAKAYNPSNPHLYGIWGSSSVDSNGLANDVYAVGSDFTITYYDGSSWVPKYSVGGQYLYGVWGSASKDSNGKANDVFFVGMYYSGGYNYMLHYTPAGWVFKYSGTPNQYLYDVWGSESIDANGLANDVFAVGTNGTITHYDGTSWTSMASGTSQHLRSVWGTSGTDVYAAGDGGTILHYDGSTWRDITPSGETNNSVTDLAFHPQNQDGIYASTRRQGVYASPNLGAKWLEIGKPDYDVLAISTGSLFAGTEGGLLQLSGTGVIAGNVTDAYTGSDIDNAQIVTDFDVGTISVGGDYMTVHPSGIFNITAIADGYANRTASNVTISGGDVIWEDFALSYGQSESIDSQDLDTSGGGGSYGCFIATAAYGSSVAPHVRILREFRDRFLLANPIGKRLVRFYYAYSPAIANVIADHDSLRALVRVSLLPLIGASWMALKIGPVFTIMLILFLGIGLVGLLVSRRFRGSVKKV